MKLVTVAEMQAIEREANATGFSYAMMMENAGRGLAEVVDQVYSQKKAEGVLGLVGSGNNGGDTLVALAYLAGWGWMATAYLARPRPEEDPLVERLIQAGGVVVSAGEDAFGEHLVELIENHAVLLDGVLGTGIRLPLKPEVAGVLNAARQKLPRMAIPPAVVAVDCPSGVDCDTGEAAAEVIPANLTVTMAAVKAGLLKFPAFEYVGELRMVGIGLPDGGMGLEAWQAIRHTVVDSSLVEKILPDRPGDAHKGTFGTAMVVAGSMNYTGAALLAGEAAYRIGAGLVTLAIPEPLHAALAGKLVEATWLPLPTTQGGIAARAAGLLLENLERVTAILVGPGFGLLPETGEFVSNLIAGGAAGQALPGLVLDADGLKLLARIPQWQQKLPASTVLTPHPGEMAVLTGLSREAIQADRVNTAVRFAREWGHVVVLKGAFTVVAAPDGQASMIPVATAALARAGTGDVLAGLIVGLRAQGVLAFPAAVAGAWIHAQAGLRAAEILGGKAAVLAGDVLAAVPGVLAALEERG